MSLVRNTAYSNDPNSLLTPLQPSRYEERFRARHRDKPPAEKQVQREAPALAPLVPLPGPDTSSGTPESSGHKDGRSRRATFPPSPAGKRQSLG